MLGLPRPPSPNCSEPLVLPLEHYPSSIATPAQSLRHSARSPQSTSLFVGESSVDLAHHGDDLAQDAGFVAQDGFVGGVLWQQPGVSVSFFEDFDRGFTVE